MSLSFEPCAIQLPDGHFIDGTYVQDRASLVVRAPSDGRTLGEIPWAGADMVDRAVQSARKAVEISGWARQAPRRRIEALHAFADEIMRNAETLARLEAIASSRPIADALVGDVRITAEQIRFFAEFADKECDDLAPTSDGQFGFIASEPYGVVGAITAWNVPVVLAGWKLGAGAGGGEYRCAEAFGNDALFHALYGGTCGAGRAAAGGVQRRARGWTDHGGGARGASGGGQSVVHRLHPGGRRDHGEHRAHRDQAGHAAACITHTILNNAGQGCVAGSRVIVEHRAADQVATRIIELMGQIAPGPTWEESTGYSSLISEAQLARIQRIIDSARSEGAEVLCGGARIDRAGAFFQPTLLSGVRPGSIAMVEEIFGPVLSIETFEDEEDAVRLARHPVYGLSIR